jgi:hypothetical protein
MLRATTGVWLVLVPLALEVVGCNGGLKPVEWPQLGSDSRAKADRQDKQDGQGRAEGLRIVPRSNRSVVRLGPENVVRVMQRVGFSDDQIIALGTDLHNAMLLSGGAEVYYGKQLEMALAADGQRVHIQSRSRGTFIYDVAKGRFLLSPSGGR